MKIPFFIPLVAASLVLLISTALAERPFLVTETAIPTERGTYRIESGLVFNRISTKSKKTGLGANLRYGVIQNLEFDLEFPYLFASNDGDSKNGPGDVLLKTKIRFIKGRAANPLSLSGQLVIKFPTAGDEDLLDTTGEVDVGFLGIASKTFASVTTHLNLGYYFVGNQVGVDLSDQLRYAIGFEFAMDENPVKLTAEFFGETETSNASTKKDQLAFLGGIALPVRKDLLIDTAIGFGLNNASPDYIINVGATYSFE